MLVTMKELLKNARERGYAVGAFNATNLESVIAVTQAAEQTGKGIVLQYAGVHSPLIPIDIIGPIMLRFAKESPVPICVHLDHGASPEECMKAIRLGFTSVMLDASDADYEANVRDTALIVRLAHSVGVTVEAELGHIFASDIGVGGAPDAMETADSFASVEDVYTDPATARDFVGRTHVDALAIAFGTAHGVYTVKPRLDLNRITAIRRQVDVPFVMHGGSGLSKAEFQAAIKAGIRKINYYTYMSIAGGKAVREALAKKSPDSTVFFHDIPLIGIEAMRKDVVQAIRIFSLEI